MRISSANRHDPAIDAAVEEGAKAARQGKPDKANPYGLDDSVRFGAWLAGWIEARQGNQH